MKELKSRFEISTDELQHRIDLQQKYHNEPIQQAVAILEAAVDKVISSLGVDTSKEPEVITMQMDSLGIFINSIEDETMPKAMGIYVSITSGKDIIPYAFVGNARLDSGGRCYCDILFFMSNKLDETGGIKIL